MTEPHNNLVSAAADLGRRDAERRVSTTSVDMLNPLVIQRLRDDERIDIQSIEKHLATPLRPRGTVTVHDPDDFIEYTNRLADEDHTTVWADPDNGKVTAVFDDHCDAEAAGWRQHTAMLQLKRDPDWDSWVRGDNSLGGQAWFAEHLENLAHTIVSPDPATMLEIARTFDAKRSVNFRSGVRIDNGDVELTYEETTKAKAGQAGKLEIPSTFTVRIAPYLGVEPAEIPARLRYRVADGELRIGYALLRPDRALRDVMAVLVARLREQVSSGAVFLGTPPAALR